MRLVLSLFALTQGQAMNWNWYESEIYFHHKGGAKNQVQGLFEDYGYPADFLALFDVATCTDDTIIRTIASWTDSTKNDFIDEITAGNSMNTFYAGILSGLTGTSISRGDLETNGVITFLTGKEVGDVMTSLTTDYFDETVALALDYVGSGTDGVDNANFMTMKTLASILGNVKAVIKGYNKEVGVSIPTGTMIANSARVFGPVIENALWIWETEVNQMEVGEWVYWKMVNFVDDVYYGPLIGLCEQKYGPFEAMRQMAVKTHEVTFLTRYLLEFEDEQTDLFSIIFFGERGHYGYDWTAVLDEYFFKYAGYLNSLNGRIEGELHIHALLFDGLISDWFYGMIKGPICGITEE